MAELYYSERNEEVETLTKSTSQLCFTVLHVLSLGCVCKNVYVAHSVVFYVQIIINVMWPFYYVQMYCMA